MGIAGVDEAGRGPVLGPLVIAGVILKQNDLDRLVKAGLTDSKLVAKKKRATPVIREPDTRCAQDRNPAPTKTSANPHTEPRIKAIRRCDLVMEFFIVE